MAKKKDKELLEEESTTESKEKSFKDIVIETTGGIIDRYIEIVKSKGTDDAFLRGLENENKKKEDCINYVMNNLTEQRIIGGDDSLMYPYIHDYYVDELKDEQVKDNWSKHIRNNPAPSKGGAKAQAKEDAKNKITEEQKQKFYEEALEEAKREAKLKAEEDFRKAEAKRKEKETKLAEKKKAEELAKKEEEKKAKEEALKRGASKQMSLFDF